MLAIDKLIPGGRGLASALLRRAATVSLDWDLRQKSRFEATDDQGRRLGVFLPRGSVVRGGDVLLAEDGSLVRVHAAAQPVMVVSGPAHALQRAAYHLGNRHVALAIEPERLLFEPDPVLADMLRRLGLRVDALDAAFEPEGGAYSAAAGHSHAPASVEAAHEAGGQPAHHGHGEGHSHEHHHHGHAHRHDASGRGAAHVHGPGCGHDHGTE